MSIGNVWDRTTAVMSGRAGILVSIAALLLFLPALVDAIFDIPADPAIGWRAAGGIVSLVAAVLSIWGTLSLIAVASDPGVDRARALAIGQQRILPALAVTLVMVIAVLLLVSPGVALFAASGFDVARARQNLEQVDVDMAKVGLAFLYFSVVALVGLGVSARLVPLLAVVVNERLGLGAFRRSFVLTRGSTWKLVGVILLLAIVVGVLLLAVVSVVAVIARLIVGADNPGLIAFGGAAASAAVAAGVSIVQAVFSTQFYLAARDRAGTAMPRV